MLHEDTDHTVVNLAAARPVTAPGEGIGHYLVLLDQPDHLERFEIGPAPQRLGRDAARDIVLADPDVSRLHAELQLVDGGILVADLGSTNGTFVDGVRLSGPTRIVEGSVLQVGGKRLVYERRNRRDVHRTEELSRDLAKAQKYVTALLPAPRTFGGVSTDWLLIPSSRLGGDAFGYEWLDPTTFIVYIVDVSGHGIGAAMHAVSLLNVMRRRALPNTELRHPDQVVSALNALFPMEDHDGMFCTMWYGVYDTVSRTLTYASAGHHPGFLVCPPRATALPLKTPGLMIGANPAGRFQADRVHVPAESVLYLFSDGVFEIVTKEGRQWSLQEFLPVLLQRPLPSESDAGRIVRAVRRVAAEDGIDDDVSVLAVTFA